MPFFDPANQYEVFARPTRRRCRHLPQPGKAEVIDVKNMRRGQSMDSRGQSMDSRGRLSLQWRVISRPVEAKKLQSV